MMKGKFTISVKNNDGDVIHQGIVITDSSEGLATYIRRVAANVKDLDFESIASEGRRGVSSNRTATGTGG